MDPLSETAATAPKDTAPKSEPADAHSDKLVIQDLDHHDDADAETPAARSTPATGPVAVDDSPARLDSVASDAVSKDLPDAVSRALPETPTEPTKPEVAGAVAPGADEAEPERTTRLAASAALSEIDIAEGGEPVQAPDAAAAPSTSRPIWSPSPGDAVLFINIHVTPQQETTGTALLFVATPSSLLRRLLRSLLRSLLRCTDSSPFWPVYLLLALALQMRCIRPCECGPIGGLPSQRASAYRSASFHPCLFPLVIVSIFDA